MIVGRIPFFPEAYWSRRRQNIICQSPGAFWLKPYVNFLLPGLDLFITFAVHIHIVKTIPQPAPEAFELGAFGRKNFCIVGCRSGRPLILGFSPTLKRLLISHHRIIYSSKLVVIGAKVMLS